MAEEVDRLRALMATSSGVEAAAQLKEGDIQQPVGGSPLHPWEEEERCHDQQRSQVGEGAYRHSGVHLEIHLVHRGVHSCMARERGYRSQVSGERSGMAL